jgi:hypothetical protein
MFPNAEEKIKAFKAVGSLTKESLVEYMRIRLKNEDYKLDVDIKLLFKVFIQGRLESTDLSDIYTIELDVPVEHYSLEGVFKVKEKREVQLIHIKTPPLENVAIMTTTHKASTISYALKALSQKCGFNPDDSFIELPRGAKAIDVLRELGSIGFAHIGEIYDVHLRGAGLWGSQLQNSEILEELISRRGGRIKVAIIQNQKSGVQIILSERGTIYSQERISIALLAKMIMEILSVMLKYNLIRRGRP